MNPIEIIVRAMRWTINLVFLALLLGLVLIVFAPSWWGLDLRGVASGSMAPTIPLGAVVIVQPVETNTILPSDIITFQSPEIPNSVVTHRVVEVTLSGGERAFRTQGDANDDPDLELVPASQVLGRVMLDLPYLGYLSQFIRTRQGWFLIVIVPAGILILMELISILKLIWSGSKEPGKEKGSARRPQSIEVAEYRKKKTKRVP